MSATEGRGVPKRSRDAGSRIRDGQAIIAVAGRAEVHLLNEVGSRIWELIDGRRSRDEIAAQIEQEFEVGLEQARADVAGFLSELAGKGMLENE